jgi:hypothetical protein
MPVKQQARKQAKKNGLKYGRKRSTERTRKGSTPDKKETAENRPANKQKKTAATSDRLKL